MNGGLSIFPAALSKSQHKNGFYHRAMQAYNY